MKKLTWLFLFVMAFVFGGSGCESKSPGDTWARPADEMVMVYVPKGEFEMGSSEGEWDEEPVHTVELDEFWTDRTEVTNAQYQRCVRAGECDLPQEDSSRTREPYYSDSAYHDFPVIYVNWHEAEAYCSWAGGRLPTEAEWEYTARGPESPRFPWGDTEPSDTLLNYRGNVGDTTEVGSYPDGASWCGALDMAGNVSEWVADWFAHLYYESSPSRNPVGPSSSGRLAGMWAGRRGLRGGSWVDGPSSTRAAYRGDGWEPAGTRGIIGFRCARDAE